MEVDADMARPPTWHFSNQRSPKDVRGGAQFVSTGFAKEIANAAQGKYYYLPNASEKAIAAAASNAMAEAMAM